MGAVYTAKTFPKCDMSALTKQIMEACNEEAYESGHGGYSGTWAEKRGYGVKVCDKSFLSAADAAEWIQNNCDKYGPLLAVKLAKPTKPNTDAIDRKMVKLEEEMSPLMRELNGGYFSRDGGLSKELFSIEPIPTQVKNRVIAAEKAIAGKPVMQTCKQCGSKINLIHVKGIQCPVCGDTQFHYTATEKRRTETLRKQIDALKIKVDALAQDRRTVMEEAATKAVEDGAWVWYVGGDCAD